ncbi:hypothetical protein GF324_06580 [bacterium]|nr:hypothetical protein [bacterium]
MTFSAPRKFMLFAVLCALLLLAVSTPGLAQSSALKPSEIHAELDSLFTLGRFNEVEIEAFRLLHGPDEPTDEERLAAFLFLGFVHVLTGNMDAATSDFEKVLAMQPDLRLDPIYVPPLIYQTFESVRLQFQVRERARRIEEQVAADTTTREPDSETQVDLTPTDPLQRTIKVMRSPAVLNMFLPGTGFFVENRVVRGIFWTSTQLGTAAGFVYSLNRSNHYRTLYYREKNPALVDDRYDQYNRWYRNAWYWGIGAGTVYLLSQLDLHLTGNKIEVETGPGLTYRRHPPVRDYSTSRLSAADTYDGLPAVEPASPDAFHVALRIHLR